MTRTGARTSTTPRDGDLGLRRLENSAGLSISALPTGCIFAIEHKGTGSRTTLNQVLASPIGGSIGRIYLRTGGPAPNVTQVLGPGARTRVGARDDRFVWDGRTGGAPQHTTVGTH